MQKELRTLLIKVYGAVSRDENRKYFDRFYFSDFLTTNYREILHLLEISN